MTTRISRRDLADDGADILRRVEAGEAFLVTRAGVPVAELLPVRPHRFVPASSAVANFATADTIEPRRFRDDVDEPLDQAPTARP